MVTEARPDITSVELDARTRLTVSSGLRCGFYYGTSSTSLKRLDAMTSGKYFVASVTGLLPDTEYLYKAYVSNGRGEICSDLQLFRTLSQPMEPEEPETPEWPDIPEEPSLPDEPVIPTPKEPVFEISHTEIDFAGAQESFYISVTTNVEYEVIIPENAGWMSCYDTSSSRCVLSADYNYSEQDRSCEVLLRSLEHDCSHIVTVRQKPLPVYELHLSHVEMSSVGYFFPESVQYPNAVRIVNDEGIHSSSGWLTAIKMGNRLSMTARKNRTDNARAEKVFVQKLYSEEQITITVIIKVIQHSADDAMTFECPAVEKKCVSLWDIDGDGKVSYAEAANASSAPERAFEGLEFTSFENFRWFIGLKELSPYMFASSALASISLPKSITTVSEGAFSNCTNLRSIELPDTGPVLWTVATSALDGTPDDMVIYTPWQYEDWYLDRFPSWEGKTVGFGR